MSRSRNSIQNLTSSVIGEILSIFLKFVTRSIFIQYMGAQYLGINGLFTNILSILSLSELGIGTAITYNLYKPIADSDIFKVNILMNFYKKVYRYIALFITIIGLLLIPFIPYIIKDDLSFININIVFLIYLMQSVSTYAFFAYKGALIKANQKEYIINYIGLYFSVFTSIVQIVSLVYFKDFTIYILTIVISNIIKNLVISVKASKMYPYLNDKQTQKLDVKDFNDIVKNTYAIALYKINSIVLNATDNIIISSFIGLEMVGQYSNYLLIIGTIKTFLSKFYQSINASLGNLHAENRSEYSYRFFKTLNFFTVYVYGIAAIGVFVTTNYFISAWIGADYLLSNTFLAILSIELYMSGINRLLITYRNSLGLFQHAKYRPLIGSVLNIFISLYLVQIIGIVGVLVGTVLSNLLTVMWYDPIVILKYGFNSSYKSYFYDNFAYTLVFLLLALGIKSVTIYVSLAPFLMFLFFVFLSVLIPTFVLHLLYRKKQEYKTIFSYILKAIKKLKKV